MAIDTGIVNGLGLGPRQTEESSERLGQAEFLELMITQLRNQDPFKPMDSGEFLGQLAQFGTVSGIGDMQRSLEELAGAVRGSQTLQAAALVDRDVWVAASEAWLPPEGSLRVRVETPEGATRATVRIHDLRGQVVAELPIGVDGDAVLEWDGTLPGGGRAEPGFYELEASVEVDGKTEAAATLVSGRVESVSTHGPAGTLSLTVTGVGQVSLRDVRDIG
ncbi:MAG TPA: flagellar hook capping FlgD N-terminal domain-containing protein [Gammaproteobacteria bacterium]